MNVQNRFIRTCFTTRALPLVLLAGLLGAVTFVGVQAQDSPGFDAKFLLSGRAIYVGPSTNLLTSPQVSVTGLPQDRAHTKLPFASTASS